MFKSAYVTSSLCFLFAHTKIWKTDSLWLNGTFLENEETYYLLYDLDKVGQDCSWLKTILIRTKIKSAIQIYKLDNRLNDSSKNLPISTMEALQMWSKRSGTRAPSPLASEIRVNVASIL